MNIEYKIKSSTSSSSWLRRWSAFPLAESCSHLQHSHTERPRLWRLCTNSRCRTSTDCHSNNVLVIDPAWVQDELRHLLVPRDWFTQARFIFEIAAAGIGQSRNPAALRLVVIQISIWTCGITLLPELLSRHFRRISRPHHKVWHLHLRCRTYRSVS